MTQDIDYYAVLGVSPSAEAVVIRAAYKALAQKYHPDRKQHSGDGASRAMAELNVAYAVLSDPDRRRDYDLVRNHGKQDSGGNTTAAETCKPTRRAQRNAIGTKWLKLWTYLLLPINALGAAIYGLVDPSLRGACFFAASCICGLIYGLHNRRSWAWSVNWVAVVGMWINASIPLVPGQAYPFLEFLIRMLIVAIFWMWPNYVYWNKRRFLFSATRGQPGGANQQQHDIVWPLVLFARFLSFIAIGVLMGFLAAMRWLPPIDQDAWLGIFAALSIIFTWGIYALPWPAKYQEDP